ncbi:hypothetical protein [Microcoleus asticus]|uniref:Uncharacterized protein n=1 Tax=Microcoleus asticus IPMA8 TaxID=2563858 RepID=A0ABX2CZE3_9CYAN|nr:hypothetical protein [Microcoleus asticus]NQE35558.1 hypothetical protein [Microcoleus asticus IPMA8]
MQSDYSRLVELLISGQSASKGSYDHLNWKLILDGGESNPTFAQLTSLHESLHYALNHSTVYGNILIAIAYLARETQNHEYLELLRALTNNCRESHEIYATYTSLLAFQASENHSLNRETFIDQYPEYKKYINQAESLLPQRASIFLKIIALESIIKACLQNPIFYAVCLPNIRDFSVAKIRTKHYPDSRLRLISAVLNQKHWDKWLEVFIENNNSFDTNYLLCILTRNDFKFSSISDTEYENLSEELSAYLDASMKEMFSQVGQECFITGEHLGYLDELLSAVNKIYPFERARIPLIANTESESLLYDLKSFTREALYIAESPIEMRIYDFSSIERREWENLSNTSGEIKYYFLVSRTKESLINQYSISDQDRELLLKNEEDFVVGFRKYDLENGQKVIRIYLLEEAEQLIEVDNYSAIKIFSNTSMILMATKQWTNKWREVINKVGQKTILFDLSPFEHIERTLINRYEQINLNLVSLQSEEISVITLVFSCERDNDSILFLAPCSELTASAIIYFVESFKLGEKLSQDAEKFEHYKADVSLVLKHLMQEEMCFSFNAMQSNFARKEFDNDGFH